MAVRTVRRAERAGESPRRSAHATWRLDAGVVTGGIMGDVVYLNGELIPKDRATVSVYDGGFLHGAGLFETMRADNGRVFRLESHLDRLVRSAQTLHVPIQRGQLPAADDFVRLLAGNEVVRGRVRLTVTSGSVLTDAEADKPPVTVCATATGQADYPDEFYEKGVSVVISPFRQSPSDPVAGHKTTNYLPRLMALRDAHARGCAEALWFTTDNLLAEGSVSNAFVVKDGEVLTPEVDTPVLPGIARAAVLELCQAAFITAHERALTINDLLDADEVFLTNSIMQVMPVIRVEKKDIGAGRPGPLSRQLLTAYRDLVATECGLTA